MTKTIAGAGCVLLLAAAAAASDDPARIWSQPSPPSREALDRLNLQMDWAVYVPMDGRKDGFASIQVNGSQLIVQTRSGLITLLDAENGGRALWRSRPGRSYQAGLAPAYNSKSVITTDNGNAFALDRETGTLQWQHDLSAALTAAPIMDENQIYLCNVQQRTVVYHLPAVSTPAGGAPRPSPPSPGGDKKTDDAKPTPSSSGLPGYNPAKAYAEDVRAFFAWDYQTTRRIFSTPVLSKEAIFIVVPGGGYLALPKSSSLAEGNAELYRFAGDSEYSAAPGHSDDAAFLGTQDAHLYAIGINSGKVLWRYIPGTPVNRPPASVDVSDGGPVDKDLYATAEGKGMTRLNRETGEPLWNIHKTDFSPDADRLLAVNPKFVYAADRVGRLLVLDRKNGTELSRYDARDFVVPVVNEETDRIYLASNDGLMVCLHDKDYATPLLYKKAAAPTAEKPLKERIQEVKDKLAKPISDPGAADKILFKTYWENFSKKYGLKMFVSAKAFKELMVPPPDDQMVLPPKVDNKPLGDALQDVLDQVGGKYTQVEDTIVIGPAKPK